MQEITNSISIDRIIMFSLIGIFVGFINWQSLKNSKRSLETVNKKSLEIVRHPIFYKWLGLIFTIVIIIITFGDTLFPEIFEKAPLIEVLPFTFPLFLLGMYLTMVGLFWNIQVDKNSDFFVYRTTFGRSYKILYNEISYYKTGKNAMIMKYKNKFFVIGTQAINYHFFLQMLIQKDVKKIFKRVTNK